MLLAIDVGNTNVVVGVYQKGKLLYHWRMATDPERTADEYGVFIRAFLRHEGLDPAAVDSVVVATVVPPVIPAVEEMARHYFHCQPLFVEPGIRTGLAIKYENPKEVGADRIANAVAALELYGAPAIVVDFGTATTFDAISPAGEYLGGAIAPGVWISAEALFSHTAQLRRVELVKPRQAIGRNTVSALQAGILYGVIGQVRELVQRMKEELGSQTRVVATGGLASMVAREVPEIEVVNPMLTLEGLRLIYERNLKKEEGCG
ncbi:MAG: type III pantothenate kinase [Firmicutes bacterium]|nr:type III pantothenate kinase [Bacillota bacterium]